MRWKPLLLLGSLSLIEAAAIDRRHSQDKRQIGDIIADIISGKGNGQEGGAGNVIGRLRQGGAVEAGQGKGNAQQEAVTITRAIQPQQTGVQNGTFAGGKQNDGKQNNEGKQDGKQDGNRGAVGAGGIAAGTGNLAGAPNIRTISIPPNAAPTTIVLGGALPAVTQSVGAGAGAGKAGKDGKAGASSSAVGSGSQAASSTNGAAASQSAPAVVAAPVATPGANGRPVPVGGVGLSIVTLSSFHGGLPSVAPPRASSAAPPVASSATSSTAALPPVASSAESVASSSAAPAETPQPAASDRLPNPGQAPSSSSTESFSISSTLEAPTSSATEVVAAPAVTPPAIESSTSSLVELPSPTQGEASSVVNAAPPAETPTESPAAPLINPGVANPIPTALPLAADTTAPVVNAPAVPTPTVNVSGLQLNSQLNLGNLASATVRPMGQ